MAMAVAMVVACAKEPAAPSSPPVPAEVAPPLLAPTASPPPVPAAPSATAAAGPDAGDTAVAPVPPAGRAPCSGKGAKDARTAALACFASRVRPALLDLAKSPKVRDYRFGDGEYLRTVLALTPSAGAPRSWPGGTPQPAFPNLVALGSAEDVKAPRAFVVVTIVMQGKLMPPDGGMELDFYLDARTLETLLVMRMLGG